MASKLTEYDSMYNADADEIVLRDQYEKLLLEQARQKAIFAIIGDTDKFVNKRPPVNEELDKRLRDSFEYFEAIHSHKNGDMSDLFPIGQSEPSILTFLQKSGVSTEVIEDIRYNYEFLDTDKCHDTFKNMKNGEAIKSRLEWEHAMSLLTHIVEDDTQFIGELVASSHRLAEIMVYATGKKYDKKENEQQQLLKATAITEKLKAQLIQKVYGSNLLSIDDNVDKAMAKIETRLDRAIEESGSCAKNMKLSTDQ